MARRWLLALVATLGVLSDAPAAVADTTIEGVVRELVADPTPLPHGASKDVHHQVLVVDGRTAYFLKKAKARDNTRVRVTGRVVGQDLEVSTLQTLGPAAGLPASGTTRVLVMLAHWGTPDGVTVEAARDMVFSDSNGWFRGGSYGSLGQVGDVTPWMRIPPPSGGCYGGHLALMADARAAAQKLGYDLAAYDNSILYFPRCGGDAAGYAGWAYVGASNTWLNGYLDRRVVVHEQGHNYGLWHSHSYLCSGGGLEGSCSLSDYGDPFDAMGSSSYVGNFNASQKGLLGWSGTRTIDLTSGGTTTLAPMSTESTAVSAAVVDQANGRRYWLEYRQATGYDSWLPDTGTDGLLVHVSGPGSGSSDTGASLIDVRPADGISAHSAALVPGDCWRSGDGTTVMAGARSALGATVTVGSGTCTYAVTVTRAGSGAGSVTSGPAGITCGSECSARFPAGSSITLAARAEAGSTFTGWGGACSGAALTCTLPVNAVLAATATFAPASSNLVANPSFESGTTGWGSIGGTLARTSLAGAPDGSYVGKATWTSGTTLSLNDTAGGGPATVASTTAGTTYVATASVRAATTSSNGKPVDIVLREATTAGATVRTTVVSRTLGTGFARIGVSATAAGSGNSLSLRVVQRSAATGNGFYADLLTLRRAVRVAGVTAAGTSWGTLDSNAKRVSRFSLTTPATVDLAALRTYVDGRGATSGTQPLRGVVYADAAGAPGALIGRTNEVTIAAGRAPGWVTLGFASPVRLAAGSYWLGTHAGGTATVARYAYTAVADAFRRNGDAYGDGSSSPFGTPVADARQLSMEAVGG